MNWIKRIARRLVERDIRTEIGCRLQSDSYWFIKGTPEEKVTRSIGAHLEHFGYWNIGTIREEEKLSSPTRVPDRCVIIYPNGDVFSSLDSSNETHEVIAKAFKRTATDGGKTEEQ